MSNMSRSGRSVGVGAFGLGVVVAALVGVGHAQEPQAAPDLGGTWQSKGWNIGADRAGAPSYTGQVRLERKEKDTYLISWLAGDKVVNTGCGLYDGRTGVFAAGYAIRARDPAAPPTPGVAIYRISADKKVMDCVGTFAGKIGEVAWEEWRRE
jgi:hypothetical protein